MMINVPEEELKIPIRKKDLTEQLEDTKSTKKALNHKI